MSGNQNKNQFLISLGSNIDPEKHLIQAADRLRKLDTEVEFSTVWQTAAVGSEGPDFLNAAALLEREEPPEEFKHRYLRVIEADLGRVRTQDKNAPRTIDLDILAVNLQACDPDLWTQSHLAVPASDLLPDLRHPDTKQKLEALASSLQPDGFFAQRLDISLTKHR